MRCRERAAFVARRRRRAPGRGQPSFHPDGALAWAGPPGSWSGPPGEMREVYRPGEYDCTALSVQLRHQGRLRGTRNHEDGRIDGVARPGDVLPRAAVGRSTRSGAAPPNCNSRTSGRRSSGLYIIQNAISTGRMKRQGGGGRALGAEGTRAIQPHSVLAGAPGELEVVLEEQEQAGQAQDEVGRVLLEPVFDLAFGLQQAAEDVSAFPRDGTITE